MKQPVLVLYGGRSKERQVSLRSGKQVAQSLRSLGHDVRLVDTADKNFNLSAAVKDVGAVVPMLHGAGGEDGILQAQLETLGVAYFGSGPEACALTFDKVKCKERLAENGILTPTWEVVNRQQFEQSDLRKSGYVLKPIDGGSTIDTLIVHNPGHQFIQAGTIDKLFKRYKTMLLEELIEGQEVTVPILGDEALPIILIVPPKGEEFDYDNKYNGRTQEIVEPEQIPALVQQRAQQLALEIHDLTGCRHISRTDMIIAENGSIYTLEVNTIPGMTAASLVPKAAAAQGMDMQSLAASFVEMAGQR